MVQSVKIIVIDQGHTMDHDTYCLLMDVLDNSRIELESLSPADCTGTCYKTKKIIKSVYLKNIFFRGKSLGNEWSSAR